MSNQKVKKQDRLKVELTLSFPNLNRFKSYDDIARKFFCEVDGEPFATVDQSTSLVILGTFRLRSELVFRKKYGDSITDSVFTYRVGNNFATLRKGESEKRVEVSFETTNILSIMDDLDFRSAVDISE